MALALLIAAQLVRLNGTPRIYSIADTNMAHYTVPIRVTVVQFVRQRVLGLE